MEQRSQLWVLVVPVACMAVSCAGSPDFDVSGPACHEAADVELRGAWTLVGTPAHGAPPGASDGEIYRALAGAVEGSFGRVNELDVDALEWLPTELESTSTLTPDVVVAGEGVLGTLASDRVEVANGRTEVTPLATWRSGDTSWTFFEPGEEFVPRLEAALHFTGTEFLVWGGSASTTDTTMGLVDDTEFVSYTDGYFYDPETGTARSIAPAWEPGHHTWSVNHPKGHLSSVWTPEGLFVWGFTVEQDATRSALLATETEEWHYYPTPSGEGPYPRRYATLSYHGGYVYLHGGGLQEGGQLLWLGPGIEEDDIYLRDFWRFSLESETWEEIEVPAWADLQVASPAWIGDELMFVGMRCTARAIYDSMSGTWSVATKEDAPPSRGEAATASGKVIVNQVFDVNDIVGVEAPFIWIFDPAATPPE